MCTNNFPVYGHGLKTICRVTSTIWRLWPIQKTAKEAGSLFNSLQNDPTLQKLVVIDVYSISLFSFANEP